jgi:hypothetical protein
MFDRIGRHRFHMALLAMASLALSACVATDPARTAAIGRIGVGDVVSGDELVASGASSLYDALVRTRRNFFVARGMSSITNPPADAMLVFRDGALMGTINVLSMMRATDVRTVRHISATETFHRYGRSVAVGGLEVELVDNR